MSKEIVCGLDFGTTNSSIGIWENDQPRLVELEDSNHQIPSAIFYDNEERKKYFGNQGIDRYLNGYSGRIIWSPKNILGSSLMGEKTMVWGKLVNFREIVRHILDNIREKAVQSTGQPIKKVVAGRPVFFCDDDRETDQASQEFLEEILHSIGFEEVGFEFEPIAAALAYEREITREEIALVVDIGGGTSDFSIIKLSPEGVSKPDRSQDILAVGGVHIAGTDIDQKLSLHKLMPEIGMKSKYRTMEGKVIEVPSYFFFDLSTWHKINFLYQPRHLEFARRLAATSDQPEKIGRLIEMLTENLGHSFFRQVEQTKIALSTEDKVNFSYDQVTPGIQLNISRQELYDSIHGLMDQIETAIMDVIVSSQIKEKTIKSIIFTGGGTMIPEIRSRVSSLLPHAEIIDIDKFGSVTKGLTIKARTLFG